MAKSTNTGSFFYEEWRVIITAGKPEKVKRLRENVKITDEQAETLNAGALGQVNAHYALMYFKP